jgi:DNA-binding transcriptional MerR regulator
VPYKETEITKLYYTIGEVSEMFDVNASLIRFWENEFEVLNPKKNNKGNRLFTAEDIANLKLIYNLVREQGLTLEGAKKYLRGNKRTVKHDLKADRTQLSEIEKKLKSIKNSLIQLKEKL